MMKIFTVLTAVLISANLWAQAPQSFSYQAIVRGANNILVSNKQVGLKISLLQGSENGNAAYVETHSPTANENGLVSISIGAGKGLSGNFTTIDWSKGLYFIKTETDPTGGANYAFTSTSQLLSVPFALYAANSQPGPKGDKGEQGLPGKDGEVGKDGIQGPIGPKGDTGLVGKQGPIGLTGPAGKDGAQGLIGPKGDTGLKGDQGIKGDPGISIGSFTHYIGEEFGGGVIFHLWKDKLGAEHGLVVATTDQSAAQAWSNIKDVEIGQTAKSSWDGLSNSNAIVNQSGHTSSAAKLCLDLVSGGQNDWYLPSNQELNMLWNNYFTVVKSLSQISGATELVSWVYWSSSEADNSLATSFVFSHGGGAYDYDKDGSYFVRAVRAF